MTDCTEWHSAGPSQDLADEGQEGMPKGSTV